MEIVGIDPGNEEVKFASRFGVGKFYSAIGEYRDRNIEDTHGKDDMIFEIDGRKGFAGTLALAESEFSGSIMGDSKAHEDAKIRILLALHRLPVDAFQIIVGQPISKHIPKEKDLIKSMLCKSHEVVVNDKKKVIRIHKVEVAAEGGAAFWSNPRKGLVRIIDAGSGTVNCASLLDGRYIDKDSFTIPFGCKTTKSNDTKEMVRGITAHTSRKWNKSDTILIAGGAAEKLLPHIKDFYHDTELMNPVYEKEYKKPIYANAIGFYKIGLNVYGTN